MAFYIWFWSLPVDDIIQENAQMIIKREIGGKGRHVREKGSIEG